MTLFQEDQGEEKKKKKKKTANLLSPSITPPSPHSFYPSITLFEHLLYRYSILITQRNEKKKERKKKEGKRKKRKREINREKYTDNLVMLVHG
jgi:hypothetical protein